MCSCHRWHMTPTRCTTHCSLTPTESNAESTGKGRRGRADPPPPSVLSTTHSCRTPSRSDWMHGRALHPCCRPMPKPGCCGHTSSTICPRVRTTLQTAPVLGTFGISTACVASYRLVSCVGHRILIGQVINIVGLGQDRLHLQAIRSILLLGSGGRELGVAGGRCIE